MRKYNLVKYIQNSFKDNKVMSVLPNGDILKVSMILEMNISAILKLKNYRNII